MMGFEEILPYFKKGKSVYRKSWVEFENIKEKYSCKLHLEYSQYGVSRFVSFYDSEGFRKYNSFNIDDILANDWLVLEE